MLGVRVSLPFIFEDRPSKAERFLVGRLCQIVGLLEKTECPVQFGIRRQVWILVDAQSMDLSQFQLQFRIDSLVADSGQHISCFPESMLILEPLRERALRQVQP
jgi:hypothetical protein